MGLFRSIRDKIRFLTESPASEDFGKSWDDWKASRASRAGNGKTGARRVIVSVCVAAGVAALVFWTVYGATGHHVTNADWPAPALAVVFGVNYLRSAARRP